MHQRPKAMKPDPGQLRGILDLGFENVVPAHEESVLGGAKERFRPTIEGYRAG